MLYMKRSPKGLLVCDKHHQYTLNKGLRQYLNELLIQELATLSGRLEATKTQYEIKKNVPIYVNEDCCFYLTKPMRDFNTICINYHSVLSIRAKDHHSEIIFKNLNILQVDLAYNKLIHKHMKVSQFLDKHFKRNV